jgi:hypothetical protein
MAITAPTVTRGTISTVTDTTNIKLDISEAIDFLSPFDVPFKDLIGMNSLSNPCTQVKHEWLEDQLRPRSGTLAAAYTVGDGEMTLASGEGTYLLPDDLILVGNVVYRVTQGAPDADLVGVTVVEGTDVAAANGSAWRKVAHAAQEAGSARDDASKTTLTRPFNYTQILKDWVIVSGTMEVIDRYGYANERAYQEQKVLKQLAIDLEHDLLYGGKSYDEGPPRKSSMGGLASFVLLPGISNSWATVKDANDGNLTESMLNDVLQEMWNNGGVPDYVLVNGTNKRRITDWATPRIRTAQGERMAGATVLVYESDFGVLDIVLDRWLRPSDVVIGTRESNGIGPLTGRQFSSRLLPSTIDGTWFEILGEYTMEVHKPQSDFGWIYDTSTAY